MKGSGLTLMLLALGLVGLPYCCGVKPMSVTPKAKTPEDVARLDAAQSKRDRKAGRRAGIR